MEDLRVKIGDKEYRVKVEEADEGKLRVHFEGEVYEVETKTDIQNIDKIAEKAETKKGGEITITAPMPGLIASVNIRKGQKININDILFKIIAMKMENEILSPRDGFIKEIRVKKGDSVNKGDLLAVIK